MIIILKNSKLMKKLASESNQWNTATKDGSSPKGLLIHSYIIKNTGHVYKPILGIVVECSVEIPQYSFLYYKFCIY